MLIVHYLNGNFLLIVILIKTETKLIEFGKQLEERDDQIMRLTETIEQLKENKQTLITQLVSDKTKIEDLEFQIEEHKLGCVDTSVSSGGADDAAAAAVKPQRTQSDKDEEDDLVMKQLRLQQEVCKNHLEETKFLKDQVETLSIELKQLRLGEEVYAQEKRDLKKSLDEIETQLNIAKLEAAENVKLKEQLHSLEGLNKKLDQEKEELKKNELIIAALNADINQVKVQLEQSENQKSEFEFLYHEESAKIGDLNLKMDEKNKEIIALKQLQNENETDVEFALEEQKVLVQELEQKLATLVAEKQTLEHTQSAQIKDLVIGVSV